MKMNGTCLTAIASLALLVLVPATTAQQDIEMAVVVNPQNPVSSISFAELREVFDGEKQSWSANLPVFPVVRAPEAEERKFLLSRVLKMTEAEYKRYWLQKVYSGQASKEPLAVFSNGMQLEAVRVKKGGIALISVHDVREGVKVIPVDRYLPGNAAYPLK